MSALDLRGVSFGREGEVYIVRSLAAQHLTTLIHPTKSNNEMVGGELAKSACINMVSLRMLSAHWASGTQHS